MPNWCTNRIKVYGPEKERRKFLNKFYEKGMKGFMPTPQELMETPSSDKKTREKMLKKYGAKDYYDWRLDNWGCKWDIKNPGYKTNDGFVYDTPWGPNTDFFLNAFDKGLINPNLMITLLYDEPNMLFMGFHVIHKRFFSDYHDGEDGWGIVAFHPEEIKGKVRLELRKDLIAPVIHLGTEKHIIEINNDHYKIPIKYLDLIQIDDFWLGRINAKAELEVEIPEDKWDKHLIYIEELGITIPFNRLWKLFALNFPTAERGRKGGNNDQNETEKPKG